MSEEQQPKRTRRSSKSRSAEEPTHTRDESEATATEEKEAEQNEEQGSSEELALERTVTGGYRSTAETPEELREEALKEAQGTDYSRTDQRPSDAGPNPYTLKKSTGAAVKDDFEPDEDSPLVTPERSGAYAEAIAESADADAEIAIHGETITDTGAKINLEPERVSAQDKAELPRAGDPFDEAVATSPEDALTSDRNPGAGAPEMDRTGETPERGKEEDEEEK